MDERNLRLISKPAQEAIRVAESRIDRSVTGTDVEAIIGSSKEFIETVAKVVLDALGHPYGSNAPLTTLASQTLDALAIHPSALQGRQSLQRLSSSAITAAQAIAELRNNDGTGHGRATRSNLDRAHAFFIRNLALAWSEWVLATANRALTERAGLETALVEIGSARVFHRGEFPAYLTEIGLFDFGEDDQRRVGLAVARRWSVNHTFMALEDVIDPIAEGTGEYPAAFCEGVLEGLVLDHNGYLQLTADDIRRAISIGARLPGDRVARVFRGLADRIDDAQPAQSFDADTRSQAVTVIRTSSGVSDQPAIQEALDRIATRLENLPPA